LQIKYYSFSVLYAIAIIIIQIIWLAAYISLLYQYDFIKAQSLVVQLGHLLFGLINTCGSILIRITRLYYGQNFLLFWTNILNLSEKLMASISVLEESLAEICNYCRNRMIWFCTVFFIYLGTNVNSFYKNKKAEEHLSLSPFDQPWHIFLMYILADFFAVIHVTNLYIPLFFVKVFTSYFKCLGELMEQLSNQKYSFEEILERSKKDDKIFVKFEREKKVKEILDWWNSLEETLQQMSYILSIFMFLL